MGWVIAAEIARVTPRSTNFLRHRESHASTRGRDMTMFRTPAEQPATFVTRARRCPSRIVIDISQAGWENLWAWPKKFSIVLGKKNRSGGGRRVNSAAELQKARTAGRNHKRDITDTTLQPLMYPECRRVCVHS